jgi:type IV pilus assembly protein PilA
MKAMVLKRMALKSKGKKGFTLVEVIVVLVILAILMALAVPGLIGYIDKARDKALEADGRNIQVALQSMITDSYKSGTAIDKTALTGADKINDVTIYEEVNKLIGTALVTDKGSDGSGGTIASNLTEINIANSQLTKFVFTKDSKQVTYTPADGLVVSAVTTP